MWSTKLTVFLCGGGTLPEEWTATVPCPSKDIIPSGPGMLGMGSIDYLYPDRPFCQVMILITPGID